MHNVHRSGGTTRGCREERGETFGEQSGVGIDLASEHVIVYDGLKTVAAMDVLVPKVGELIGGSQTEERFDVIKSRMEEMELPLLSLMSGTLTGGAIGL